MQEHVVLEHWLRDVEFPNKVRYLHFPLFVSSHGKNGHKKVKNQLGLIENW